MVGVGWGSQKQMGRKQGMSKPRLPAQLCACPAQALPPPGSPSCFHSPGSIKYLGSEAPVPLPPVHFSPLPRGLPRCVLALSC